MISLTMGNGLKKGVATLEILGMLSGGVAPFVFTGCQEQEETPNEKIPERTWEDWTDDEIDAHNETITDFDYSDVDPTLVNLGNNLPGITFMIKNNTDSTSLASRMSDYRSMLMGDIGQTAFIKILFNGWKAGKTDPKSLDFANVVIQREAEMADSARLSYGSIISNALNRGLRGEGSTVGIFGAMCTFYKETTDFDETQFRAQLEAYLMAAYVAQANKDGIRNFEGKKEEAQEKLDKELRTDVYAEGKGKILPKGDAVKTRDALKDILSKSVPACLLQQFEDISEFKCIVNEAISMGIAKSWGNYVARAKQKLHESTIDPDFAADYALKQVCAEDRKAVQEENKIFV